MSGGGSGGGRRRPPYLAPLLAVGIGGLLGASARHGLKVTFPRPAGVFPWTTFAINVGGCLLIGVLTVWLARRHPRHSLAHPFLSTGVLGGFTTFSDYSADTIALINDHAADVAAVYWASTLLAAMTVVWAGGAATRAILRQGGGAGNGPPSGRHGAEHRPREDRP